MDMPVDITWFSPAITASLIQSMHVTRVGAGKDETSETHLSGPADGAHYYNTRGAAAEHWAHVDLPRPTKDIVRTLGWKLFRESRLAHVHIRTPAYRADELRSLLHLLRRLL